MHIYNIVYVHANSIRTVLYGHEDDFREKVSTIFVWVKPVITRELIASFPSLKVAGNCAVGYGSMGRLHA